MNQSNVKFEMNPSNVIKGIFVTDKGLTDEYLDGYGAGYRAWHENDPVNEQQCPYDDGSQAAMDWHQGWTDGFNLAMHEDE